MKGYRVQKNMTLSKKYSKPPVTGPKEIKIDLFHLRESKGRMELNMSSISLLMTKVSASVPRFSTGIEGKRKYMPINTGKKMCQ